MNIWEVGSAIQNKGSFANPPHSLSLRDKKKTTLLCALEYRVHYTPWCRVVICNKKKKMKRLRTLSTSHSKYASFMYISLVYHRSAASHFSIMPKRAEQMRTKKALRELKRMKGGMRLWWDPTTQLPNTCIKQNISVRNNHCNFIVMLLYWHLKPP